MANVAEEVKRKRGRPPKNKTATAKGVNEEAQQIKMTAQTKTEEPKTLNQIQSLWSNTLQKYSGMVSVDVMNKAVNNAMLTNPFIQNQRVKTINSLPNELSKDQLQTVLKNPASAEQQLRDNSMQLYYTNFVYNNLIRLEREIPTYYWYATPQYVDKTEMKEETFKKEMQFVNRIVESFNPQLAFKTINMQVQLEGKCSYLVRKSYKYPKKVNFFLLEKLLPNEVKITGIANKQQYTVSFNMMIFQNPMYDVSQYPPYIEEIWKEMQTNGLITQDRKTKQWSPHPSKILSPEHLWECVDNSYYYWVELDQDDCFTFGQELATPMCFPDTIGLFMDLRELDDYRWLMGSLMSKGVTSILTGEVPIDKDAKAGSDGTIVTPDLVQFYDSLFSKTVSANVMTYFAPFKNFELHNIDSQPDNMDIVYNRLRDLVATSGNAALLSISDKPSVSMVKATQAIAASRANYLTLQFQQFLNNVINNQFDLKHQYKITLWGDIFDTSDNLKMAKELLQNGIQSMLPRVLSAFNQTVEDMKTINDYIEVSNIVIYARNIANENNNTKTDISNNEQITENGIETKKVGRTTVEETEIESDSTAASKDRGDNVSDTKEFSSS